jgi:type VI secretion system protein ImpA
MDVDALLAPRSEDEPSGPDLVYEDLIELERVATHEPEREMGDSVIPAKEPEWEEVVPTALGVLEKSHDLRAAVYLAEASLRRDGLKAFSEVLRYIRGCLEQHWETCHPQLDEDDGDPTERVNAVAGLTDNDTVLQALRLAPLTNSRVLGRFCLRDILVLEERMPQPRDMETVPDRASVLAAFEDTAENGGDWLEETREAVSEAREHLKAIAQAFTDNLGAGDGPTFTGSQQQPLNISEMLDLILKSFATYGPGTGGAEEGEQLDADAEDGGAGVPAAAGGGGGPARSVGGAPGSISSPADVSKALDKICDYYARYEPSSPVPLLLRRAQRLVSADFVTIIKDMAPGGYDNVELIGGLEEEDE